MARYIDADKAIDALTGWDTDPTDEEIKWTIDKIPTADVAEVKHGKWECVNESENVWMCTGADGCGGEILLLEGTPHDYEWNYCPNCGAKMDGGAHK